MTQKIAKNMELTQNVLIKLDTNNNCVRMRVTQKVSILKEGRKSL